jgi:hypothetical protein
VNSREKIFGAKTKTKFLLDSVSFFEACAAVAVAGAAVEGLAVADVSDVGLAVADVDDVGRAVPVVSLKLRRRSLLDRPRLKGPKI